MPSYDGDGLISTIIYVSATVFLLKKKKETTSGEPPTKTPYPTPRTTTTTDRSWGQKVGLLPIEKKGKT